MNLKQGEVCYGRYCSCQPYQPGSIIAAKSFRCKPVAAAPPQKQQHTPKATINWVLPQGMARDMGTTTELPG